AMLPDHEVYITDWIDARNVPLADGPFGLDDYIDYLCGFCGVLHAIRGERPAVMGVCQPGVPLLAAASLMAEDGDEKRPSSIILMGSPIDTTRSPTEPNVLATTRPLSWFEKNVIVTVPFPNPGFMRRVYPGFLQLSGFMSMNLDRHVGAHMDHFQHLIEGDGDSVEAHNVFYDEYLAVMDMTADFYLETIETVFQKHSLPRGEMTYRGERRVRPEAITDIALMTVEGEKDDITGRGQTAAAHGLCVNLPGAKKFHWEQEKVGHYGVFNGSRFRTSIRPRIAEFIAEHRLRDRPAGPNLRVVTNAAPKAAAAKRPEQASSPKTDAAKVRTAAPGGDAKADGPALTIVGDKPAETPKTSAKKAAPRARQAAKPKGAPAKASAAKTAEATTARKPAATKTATAKSAAAKTATTKTAATKAGATKTGATKAAPSKPRTRRVAAKNEAATRPALKVVESDKAPAKDEAGTSAAKAERGRTPKSGA
ncbi:MAG: polyhydroxyalkanoate depolymerase, partial [Pseudomonadota bacterium]